MIVQKNRILSYLLSLLLLIFLINTIPASQPIKYILFIIINFFIITFPYKINFYRNKNLFTGILFFLILILISNYLPIKFSMKIQSFGNIDYNLISKKAFKYYENNYPDCFKNSEKCYWVDNERPKNLIYGKQTQNNNNINIKVKNTFKRNYLNIKNLNELRSNLFSSPGTTMHMPKYDYINVNNYPFIINLNFPKIYQSSKICKSKLDVEEKCYIIKEKNRDFEFIDSGEKNSLYLKQNINLILIKLIISILMLISFLFIMRVIFEFKIRDKIELLYPTSLILILFIISFSNNINFLNTYLYQYAGGDGFLYLYWGNLIAQAFTEFNFYYFFRGGADIFYWMPGMRFFIGIEKIIFGNSYFLHLIILSMLPFILRKLLTVYFSNKIVTFLILSFLFVPIMHHMGFSYFQFFRYFTKVFSEPVAYTIFFLGLVRLVYFYEKRDLYYNTLPLTCLIIIVSCIMRPNLTFSSFFILIFPFFYLLKNKEFKIFILFSISGLLIFLPLIHNFFYGGRLVLFTTAAFSDANIKITLKDYYVLLTTFNIDDQKRIMLIEMLKNFINPFEIHKYFILIGLFLTIRHKLFKISKLIPLLIIIFTQFILFFFLNPGPRYMWVFWILALIVSLYFFLNRKEKIQI